MSEKSLEEKYKQNSAIKEMKNQQPNNGKTAGAQPKAERNYLREKRCNLTKRIRK